MADTEEANQRLAELGHVSEYEAHWMIAWLAAHNPDAVIQAVDALDKWVRAPKAADAANTS